MARNFSIEQLRDAVSYNPDTGEFVRLVQSTRSAPGTVLGQLDGRGYMAIRVFGERIKSHVLAWFYVTEEWPTHEIDHIDGNGLNNAWANLRKSSRYENQNNVKLRKDNKTGVRGVMRCSSGSFCLQFHDRGGLVFRGTFPTLDGAREKRDALVAEMKPPVFSARGECRES